MIAGSGYTPPDVGTAEQHKRGIYAEEGRGREKHARHVTQMPCDFYLHRQWIKPYQWEAANMLFEGAVLCGMNVGIRSVLASSGGVVPDGLNHIDGLVAAQQDARKQVRRALEAVKGNRRRNLVAAVCIDGIFIKAMSQTRREVSDSMVMLRMGLNNLAKFYRLL